MKTFFITQTNKIVDENNTIVIMEESNPLYLDFLEFLRNNGTVENTTFLPQEDVDYFALEAIKKAYEKHKLYGEAFYDEYRAKIVKDIYDRKITEQQAFIIESNLKVGFDRISQTGDWKTGYYELSKITATHVFVEPYLSDALNLIQQYIVKHYTQN